MFGTLVSHESQQDALGFIENPDPVAAVSRNLQNTKHVACMSCRSRKAACSGRRAGCQRCVLMKTKCVYPGSLRGHRRQESVTSSEATTKSNRRSPTRVLHNGAEESAKNKEAKHSHEPESNDLQDRLSNDSDTNMSDSLVEVVCTPTHDSSDAGSRPSNTENLTSASDITRSESSHSTDSDRPPLALSDQFSGLFETDTTLSSLLSPAQIESIVDMDLWEEMYSMHSCDTPWMINTSKEGTTAGPMVLEPPYIKPAGVDGGSKTPLESDSCSCLLSSIIFLEKLACKSASCESRIDVILADVRNSMKTLAAFIACKKCEARAELNIVLAMAARNIAIICGRLANSYKHLRGLSSDTNNNEPSHQHQSHRDTSTTSPVDISVSTYSVDQREGLHLLESLTTFQIIDFQRYINIIKSRYPHQTNQGQAGALTEAENIDKNKNKSVLEETSVLLNHVSDLSVNGQPSQLSQIHKSVWKCRKEFRGPNVYIAIFTIALTNLV